MNAPFIEPNNSDSNNSAGIAAQFMATNLPPHLPRLSVWIKRATISFPVPF